MKTLVCLGDSLVEGEGDELSLGGWVGRLAQKLKPHVWNSATGWRVYNMGIGGDKIRDLEHRLSEVLIRSPYMVIIGCGANDMVGKDARAQFIFEQHKESWRRVLTQLKAVVPNVLVTFGFYAGTDAYEANWRSEFKDEFVVYEQSIMQLCKELEIPYVQLEKDFSSARFLSDGLHYNAQGYEALAHKFHQKLTELNWI